MPIYEYECEKGHRFERYASITEKNEPLPKVGCPSCSGKNGRVSRATLVFSRTGEPKLKAGSGGFFKPNA